MSSAEYFIQYFNSLRYFHGEVISQACLIGVWEFKAKDLRMGVKARKVHKKLYSKWLHQRKAIIEPCSMEMSCVYVGELMLSPLGQGFTLISFWLPRAQLWANPGNYLSFPQRAWRQANLNRSKSRHLLLLPRQGDSCTMRGFCNP